MIYHSEWIYFHIWQLFEFFVYLNGSFSSCAEIQSDNTSIGKIGKKLPKKEELFS